MQPRPDPRRWLVVTNAEHAILRFDSGPSAPARDERARERCVEEIDRHGVIQHAAHAGRRHCPSVRAAIFVKPGGHFRIALAEAAGRNADPDADGKAPLRNGDHLSRVARHP